MRLHGSLRTGQATPAPKRTSVRLNYRHGIHAQRSAASKQAQGIAATAAAAAAAAVTPAARWNDRSFGFAWLPSQPSKRFNSSRSVQARYREPARDTEGAQLGSNQSDTRHNGVPDSSFIPSSEAAAFNELTAEATQQASDQSTTPFNSSSDSIDNPTESLQEAFSELFPVAPARANSTAAAADAAATTAADTAVTDTVTDADSNGDIPSAMPTPHGTHASSGVAWQKDGRTAGMKPKQTSVDKLKVKLDDMASKYKALDSRLDSLETTLVDLLHALKQKAKHPAAAAAVGPTGQGWQEVPGVGSAVELPEFEYDPEAEDKEGGLFDLKKLQTSLTENINRGYLESVKHLRELLMAYEWHLHGKELAERKGVAEFEKYCAEHDVDIDFEAISKLYQNPNDWAHLPDNKTRLLARSIIQTAVDDRYCSIYFECTNTAKELAHTSLKDLIPDSAGKVGGVIKDVLPLPGFLKK